MQGAVDVLSTVAAGVGVRGIAGEGKFRGENDAVAEAAGLRVLRVETINVAGEENVVPLQFAAKVEGGVRAAARPVQTVSGEQEVSVRVSVQVGVSKR